MAKHITTVGLTEAERETVSRLKQRLGRTSRNDVVRLGIRILDIVVSESVDVRGVPAVTLRSKDGEMKTLLVLG